MLYGGLGGEGRERKGGERGEDSVIERERERVSESRRVEAERGREKERGPALTAHIAGWLAGSLTVDE